MSRTAHNYLEQMIRAAEQIMNILKRISQTSEQIMNIFEWMRSNRWTDKEYFCMDEVEQLNSWLWTRPNGSLTWKFTLRKVYATKFRFRWR